MLTPRDQLLSSHDEFRKLATEHMQYAQRLDSLTQKRFLTDDEKLEEVRLKKLKLRLSVCPRTLVPRGGLLAASSTSIRTF